MKKLLFLTTVVLLAGCEGRPKPNVVDTLGGAYYIVKIEDCEYIRFSSYGSNYGITHKGNCNNPIHRLR